jgi:hypothetical protein
MIEQATATQQADDDGNLRLGVLDEEDLAVISAHLQNAEARVADMAFLSLEKRFAMVVSRLDWPLAVKGSFVRRRTGVHFERVMKAARSGFAAADAEAADQLLAITFEPVDPPGGFVRLTFAGGAQIRLTVECLEAEMRDLGPRWDSDERPASPVQPVP